MKKLITTILIIFLIIPFAMAQTVQQGMKYQAVARDLNGDLMANQQISLRITLHNQTKTTSVNYTEVHSTVTNQFGLFSLVIGDGKIENGKFSEIPWSSEDIWMTIEIKGKKSEVFSRISSTKLLAVPYAYYALEAGELVGEDFEMENFKNPKPPKPSKGGHWDIEGNIKAEEKSSAPPLLGNADYAPISIITDDIERLRITEDGDIITADGEFTIGGNLEVQGEQTKINKDLNVGRDVFLNESDEFEPRGETINYGNFTVMDESSTLLTGTLDVVKDANFDKNLTVADTLFTDVLETNKLKFEANVPDGEFLATFENTNTTQGDGIKIKLGQRATKNNLTSQGIDLALNEFVFGENGSNFSAEDFATLKGLLDGDLNPQDLAYLALLQVPTTDDLLAIGATVCNLTETIGNSLIDFLNSNLNLPKQFGPYKYLGVTVVPKITVFPKIPNYNLPCEALGEGFELPTLGLEDIYVSNPLNNENTFIEFTDNTDWKMGGITAQSIGNWAIQYLDPVFMQELYMTFKGIDKSVLLPKMKAKGMKIAKEYLAIGVQYSSGNGDYAEWLERANPSEIISAGDIVAVKGGKITKDLTNSEQIMAVSHRPIVLGNIPKEGKSHLGNNVAFMGQIPVKIMGPVETGDYIVANGEITGYGVAISPKDMTLDDFKRTVGRSWDSNLNDGPKMVNTVVGIHNGDYLNILKRYEEKFKNSEDRLESLEAKVDNLVNKKSANNLIK